eukprot:9338764-Heterocapsa_arctica.AAC.1
MGLPVERRAGIHRRARVCHSASAQRVGPQIRPSDDEAPKATEAIGDGLQGGVAEVPPQPPQA